MLPFWLPFFPAVEARMELVHLVGQSPLDPSNPTRKKIFDKGADAAGPVCTYPLILPVYPAMRANMAIGISQSKGPKSSFLASFLDKANWTIKKLGFYFVGGSFWTFYLAFDQ